MPRYEWTEQYTEVRHYSIDAETLEEAKAKRLDGPWHFERTLDFHSYAVVSEMIEVEDGNTLLRRLGSEGLLCEAIEGATARALHPLKDPAQELVLGVSAALPVRRDRPRIATA